MRHAQQTHCCQQRRPSVDVHRCYLLTAGQTRLLRQQPGAQRQLPWIRQSSWAWPGSQRELQPWGRGQLPPFQRQLWHCPWWEPCQPGQTAGWSTKHTQQQKSRQRSVRKMQHACGLLLSLCPIGYGFHLACIQGSKVAGQLQCNHSTAGCI